jgi:hypothetical protein
MLGFNDSEQNHGNRDCGRFQCVEPRCLAVLKWMVITPKHMPPIAPGNRDTTADMKSRRHVAIIRLIRRLGFSQVSWSVIRSPSHRVSKRETASITDGLSDETCPTKGYAARRLIGAELVPTCRSL